MSSKFVLKRNSSGAAANGAVVGEYVFDGGLFTIGSDADSTIVLPEAAAEQAVVVQEKEHLTLFNRSEGTIFNGQNLRRESMQPLASGDEIKIGDHSISFISVNSAGANGSRRAGFAAPATAAPPDIFATSEDLAVAHLAPPLEVERDKPQIVDQRENKPAPPPIKNTRNFADVLNALRTEEDSFYFIVENGRQENRRIPLEKTEMPLGTNAHGEICGTAAEISVLYAILRKDWSGIIIETQRTGVVFVNGEASATTRRLRNGDIVSFNAARRQSDKTTPFLKLHEPSSLVALESLLENRERGEGIRKNLNGAGNPNLTETENITPDEPEMPFAERRFFGYFNFFEIAAMIIGTLIGVVLMFLLLEYFVG